MKPGERVRRPGQGHVKDQSLPFSAWVLLHQLGLGFSYLPPGAPEQVARVHLRPTTGLLRNVSPRRVAGNSTWDGKDKKKMEAERVEGGGGGGERGSMNQHKGGEEC